jgi:large subunit ribosomal protein L21
LTGPGKDPNAQRLILYFVLFMAVQYGDTQGETLMFAVVETSGKQYRVEPGEMITVDRMDVEVGSTIDLGNVLLVSGDDIAVGTPTVAGAVVKAKVIAHPKGKKVITFKFRRRHRMRKKRGFRASLTTLEISSIETV